MNLDEAIDRYTNNAKYERTHGNLQGYLEFKQLAEWLKDYKRLLEQQPCEDTVSRQAALNSLIDNTHLDGYDLAEALDAIENKEKLPPVTQIPIECEDAVSREAALEKMADYVASGYADSAEDFEEYSRIICQLPSVTHKSGKWIPVSERLPEDGTYLVTLGRVVGGLGIDIRSFTQDLNKVDEFDFPKHKSGWYDYDSEYGYWEDTDVIAWMPLPEPYKMKVRIRNDKDTVVCY